MYYFSSFYERKPNELEQIEYNKTNLNDSTKNINPTLRKLLNNFDGKKKLFFRKKLNCNLHGPYSNKTRAKKGSSR